MTQHHSILSAGLLIGLLCFIGLAQAGDEKIDLAKVPKGVIDAVTAKFPKAKLVNAARETEDGKQVYEIGIELDKEHFHAMVTAEGKLYEVHREIDVKKVPDVVAKAIQAKYPKAKWESAEQVSDAADKVIAFEVVVEASPGMKVEVRVDSSGMIRRETKIDPKKTAR
jgi:hypothetical protein